MIQVYIGVCGRYVEVFLVSEREREGDNGYSPEKVNVILIKRERSSDFLQCKKSHASKDQIAVANNKFP